MFAAWIALERGFQRLELSVPIDQTTTHDPLVNNRRKAGQWEADGYGGQQHRDRSLCMDREPQRQMPLHKRWTVFVKIDSRRCDGIFYIRAVREFTGALKDICSTMSFYHCLHPQLEN